MLAPVSRRRCSLPVALRPFARRRRIDIAGPQIAPEPSPQLLVYAQRVAKVLDGGVAAGGPGAASSLPVAGPAYPTEAGLLVGTPRTASPEQARCEAVDARADVYADGLLMYTLLVGQGPFAHLDDPLEVLEVHVREVPCPPSLRAPHAIPPALDRAVLRALAMRPEERFQSAEAFAEELGRIAAGLAGAGGSTGTAGSGGAAPVPGAAAGGRVGGGDAAAAWAPEIGAWLEAMPAGAGAGGTRAHGAGGGAGARAAGARATGACGRLGAARAGRASADRTAARR
ncbi:hypothetical protein [Sorangium sp. So ce1182]|uniref:hypothetical protein n=1 Tax=Sorangium sp. So ce1182 TaxID=3133334 RepID=UPI003F605E55